MGVVIRHYVAVKDGVVIGSRSTTSRYLWTVAIKVAGGWFATFHRDLASAEMVRDHHYESFEKALDEAIETPERVAVGAAFEKGPDEEEGDDEVYSHEQHAQRQAELLEGCWRNS
jgi:hypothetical protein